MIRVLKLSGEELAAAAVKDVTSVKQLKQHLHGVYGLPVNMQQIVQDGRILQNAEKLDAPTVVQLVLVRQSQREVDKALYWGMMTGHVEIVLLLLGLVPTRTWSFTATQLSLLHATTASLRSHACSWKLELTWTCRTVSVTQRSLVHATKATPRSHVCFWKPAPTTF